MTTFADLSRAQNVRDEGIQAGRALLLARRDFLLQAIDAWADRTHRGAGPLLGSDPEMAHALARWGWTRLRAEVKRALARDTPPAGLTEIIGLCEIGFKQRLDVLRSEATSGGGVSH